MSTEICQICKQECTPWFYISGHICHDCGYKFQEWIDIDEQSPQKNQTILCFCPDEKVTSAKYRIATHICNEIRTIFNENITADISHWMPLTSPQEPDK